MEEWLKKDGSRLSVQKAKEKFDNDFSTIAGRYFDQSGFPLTYLFSMERFSSKIFENF